MGLEKLPPPHPTHPPWPPLTAPAAGGIGSQHHALGGVRPRSSPRAAGSPGALLAPEMLLQHKGLWPI